MDPTLRYTPAATSAVADSITNKVEEVKQAGLAKRAELSGLTPGEQLMAEFRRDVETKTNAEIGVSYGAQLAEEARRLRQARELEDATARRNRTADESLPDAALSMARTAVGLVGGTLNLAGELGNEIGPGGAVNDLVEQIAPEQAAEAQRQRDEFSEGFTSGLAKVDRWLGSKMSDVSQINERRVAEANAADSARHAAESGEGLLETSKRVGKDLWSGVVNTAENPTALSNVVVGQAPTLGIGLGAKAAVTAEQVAARAALLAEARGLQASRALATEASEQLARRNLMVGVGATEGGAGYQQAAAEIFATPVEQLAERFPDFAAAVAAGQDPEQARAELARQVGFTTAAIVAPAAGAISKVAADFELAPLSGRGLTQNATNVVQETVEEALQSGTGEFAQNAAVLAAGDDSVDLADGVGIAAGQGAAGGFGMSAAFQAPSAAANTAIEAGEGALRAGRAAVQPVLDRIAGVEGERAAAVDEQRAQVHAGIQEAGETVAAAINVPEQDQSPLAQDVSTDPILSPETAAVLKGGDAAAPLSRVGALSRALQAMDDPAMADDAFQQMGLFAVKAARELRQSLGSITDEGVRAAALRLTENEVVRNFENSVRELPAEQVEAFFARIPSELPQDMPLTPEVAQAFEAAKQIAYTAPDRLTVAQAEVPLYHSEQLSDADKRQFELARDLAKLRDDYQAGNADIKARTRFKSQDVVANEIAETGFALGDVELKSVNQHVRDVASAAASGDVQTAALQMSKLAQFARGLRNKAAAFDGAAKAQIDAGKEDRWFDVAGTRRLAGEKKLGNLQNAVNIHVDKSRGLIEAVHSDANAVAAAYNLLAQTFPEVVAATQSDASPLPAAFEDAVKPSWTKHTKPAEVVDEAAAAVPADADPGVDAEPAPVRAEPRPAVADPARDAAPAQAAAQEGTVVAEAGAVAQPEVMPAGERGTVRQGATRATYDVLDDGTVRLNNLTTPPKDRGKGLGRTVLREFLAQVDAADRVSTLTVAPMGAAITADGLQRFYESEGYVVTGRDDDGNPLMRRPSRSERAAAPAPEPEAETAPQTVADRFQLLIREIQGSPNQLLKSFRLAANSRSLFAREEDPVAKLQTAAETGALKDLLPEDQRYVRIDDEQHAAIAELVREFVPAIVQRLNQNLAGSKQAQQLLNPNSKTPVWDFANRKSLHATVDAEGTLIYQPRIAEAMALAGIHWAMTTVANPAKFDVNKVSALFEDGVIPPHLLPMFQTAHYAAQPLRTLASELTQVLGIRGDSNAPRNQTDGLPKALASDIAVAMSELGMIELLREKGTQGDATLAFLRFPDSTDPKSWSLRPLRSRLKTPSVLTRLLLPDHRDMPVIGKAPAAVDTRVQGTGQPLSAEQTQMLKGLQGIGFKRNSPLMDFLGKLGGEQVQRLLGYQDVNLDSLNAEHRRTVAGKNLGLAQGWERLVEYDQLLHAYAEANGMDVAEVPMHFSWSLISNGRAMANGFSPQADKLAREVLTANRAVLDLNDERHLLEYYLTIAQALGVKTEQLSNIAATEQIERTLSAPEYRAVIGDIQTLLTSDGDADLAAGIVDQMQALGIKTARGMHALFAQARFEQAIANGETQFEHQVAFELDGKTDGPINAMVHFGLHTVNDKILGQLAQGGFFVNEDQRTTLNAHGKAIGDLYGASAAGLQAKLRNRLGQKLDAPERSLLNAAIVSLRELDMMQIDDDFEPSSLEVGRGVAKHGVMATVYGSGERSIVAQLAYQILDRIYADMSAAIADDQALSPETVERIRALMGSKRVVKRSGVTFERVDGKFPSRVEDYVDFRFSPAQMDALIQNLRGTVGGMLVDSINAEMAPVKETFQKLIAASTLQTVALRRAFADAYEAKRQALVAAGTIGSHDALSPNQEAQILKDLAHLVPAYATRNGGTIHVGVKDFSGQFTVGGNRQQVASIAGGLAQDIAVPDFTNPGVRVAALYTIGLGDATMMGQMFQRPRNMLDVYDGLEVSAGEILAAAREVNEAVWNGWQFDALGAVRDSFAQLELDVDSLSTAEIAGIFQTLRVDSEPTAAALKEFIADLQADLAERAAQTAAHKQAIAELPGAVDHMSGGQNPHLIPGRAGTVTEPASYIQTRAAEIRASADPAPSRAVVESELAKRLPDLEFLGIAELDKFQLQALLATYPFQSKLHRFVVNQIEHLLPEDLRVFIGTPSRIAAEQARLFPGVDLGGAREVGAYYQGTVFVKTTGEETLVHELVHATTIGLVRQFYAGGKGLTPAQKDAVRSLEQLAREFAVLDSESAAVGNARGVVAGHLAQGNTAEAVNEFMAWTLTNREVARALHRAPPSSAVKQLAKSVLSAVRKLLGLPLNRDMESFLEQTLGQFHRLVRRPELASVPEGMALFQQLTGPTSPMHALHLEQLHAQLTHLLESVPEHQLDERNAQAMHRAFLQANEIRDAFLDAGFALTDREQLVFELVQAAMASGLELDPRTLSAMQELQSAAIAQLGPEDFMPDPQSGDQIEIHKGQRRFNALLGVGTSATDALGRSNLLANFVAMALVYEPLRKKLSGLSLPKAAAGERTLDGQLRALTTRAFDYLSRTATATAGAPNVRYALDLLTQRLAKVQDSAAKRSRTPTGVFEQAENMLRNGLGRFGEIAENARARRNADGKIGGIDGWINGALLGLQALTSEQAGKAVGETILQMANTSSLPTAARELLGELVGVTDSNADVVRLLNQAKHMVARVRQRLREEAPALVRQLFKAPLTDAQWRSLHLAAGRTDLQSLLGAFNAQQIRRMLVEPAYLQAAIANIEGKLAGDHSAAWFRGARDLATYMVTGDNEAPLLRRNAAALARRFGERATVAEKDAERAEPLLDRLVTLRAVELLGEAEKGLLAQLLETEKDGVEGLLNILASLTRNELGKPDGGRQRFNRWKGYVPKSVDPRTDLVLAGPRKGEELLKRGYRRVGYYSGDRHDPSAQGLAYYASTISKWGIDFGTGGQATYNQGAMQTVEGTVGGVDRLTGRTQDPAVKTVITHPETVAAITRAKLASGRNGGANLAPIFNHEGTVVGYERVLDKALLEAHLETDTDLAKSVGIWLGRQSEETIARAVNEQVVSVLKAAWDKGEAEGRQKEFVDITAARNGNTLEAWGAIPRETQNLLKAAFGGPVMVRKDMMNNALGYRSASIADVFTGMGELPADTRQLLEKAAYATLGKNAYGWLVVGERTWQGLVGSAKDWIVVRSGVVALANAIANQWQLLMHGINPVRLVQVQAAKFLETETHLRNERRLAQITLERAAATRPDVIAKLDREAKMLTDANARLSIAPLIAAGELPSIAEGLSEQDEYSLLTDATRWLEEKTKGMPKGLMTAARYAVIAKDTAIYQGLNRAVQFGDFVAKAALYEHLIEQGRTQEQALRLINERFVNYNLLAGRTRDYAEGMGLTWFLNYKLRIQKVVLSTIRENPLRFLLAGAGADWLGADSLMTSSAIEQNWGYAFGPGQFFRAHDMLMWGQLMD